MDNTIYSREITSDLQTILSMLTHSIITLLPLFVSLFGVVVLRISPERDLPKKFLYYFMIVVSVNYFIHALYFSYEYKLFALLENIWFFTSLSVFPLYYIYIRLLSKDLTLKPKLFWLIAPAALVSIFSFGLYFSMSAPEKEIYIKGLMYRTEIYNNAYPRSVKLLEFRQLLYKIIFVIQIPIYLILGYRRIILYNRNVEEFYSSIQGKSLCRINWVLIALVFTSVIAVISGMVGKEFFIDKGLILAIPSVSHSLFLVLIIFVGFHQNFTIRDYTNEVDAQSEEKSLAESHTYPKGISKESLEELMVKDNVFTDPDLRIIDVAKELQTNRTYISRIVNEELNHSFSEWVNNYRIEHAKNLMTLEEYSNSSLQDISEMSGFSSLSAFYRAFNKREKQSPGNYRKKLEEQ